MTDIVADSGPIISFARAGRLDLLESMFTEIIVPESVYFEIVGQRKDKPGAIEVSQACWVKVAKVRNPENMKRLPGVLGIGEAEAIILASELDAFILLDDRRARIEAKSMGLKTIGSLDIICQAKTIGCIKSVKETLDEFVKNDFRISSHLYEEVLKRAGEL